MLRPIELRCEYLVEPLGIDETSPRLSWAFGPAEGEARGLRQTAYHLIVASQAEDLTPERADLWNSGRVLSDSTVGIEYAGKPLESRDMAFWTVRTWDERGDASAWAPVARWTMGLLDPDDWQGRWIGLDEEVRRKRLPARMLRKEFELGGAVGRATVYVSGLGFHEIEINGRRVGDHLFDPGLTNYDRRVLYVTHDVTSLLQSGRNAIGVTLGNGRFFAPRWFPPHTPQPRAAQPDPSFEPYATRDYGFPKLLLQLEVDYIDGRRYVVATDESWRLSTDGPIRANNEYDGEEYDARRAQPGSSAAGFHDSAWHPAALVDPPQGALQAQMIQPIRVLDVLRPVSKQMQEASSWLFDLGQAIYGVPRISVRGQGGGRVAVRAAYSLRADGRLRVEDNRTARVTDIYTLRGDDAESWHARFRGQGFRYIEVTADPGVEVIDVEGLVVATDCRPVGEFTCSDPLLERIWRNVWWGHRIYKRSAPLEPDRDERQGWLGDPARYSESDGYSFDVAAYYRKWLDDILLEQRADGDIPEVAPAFWEAFHGDLVWPSVVTILPEWLYEFYGDRRAIERAYPAIVRWLAFVETFQRPDGTFDFNNGDWCDASTIGLEGVRPIGATPRSLIATAYHANNLRIASRFAHLLEESTDARRFASRASDVRDTFNDRFLDPARGVYGNGTQCSYLLPLAFDLVPQGSRSRVIKNFVDEIVIGSDGHLSVGLIGMQWLMQTLSRIGHPDVAYLIASQTTQPSWGYMVEHNATTIWERWDTDTQGPGMNSEALLILAGSLGSWFSQSLAGLELDPSVPAWRRAILRPQLVGGLTSASAAIDSVAGRYESAWQVDSTQLEWRVRIPPNATATAWIPTRDARAVMEGGAPVSQTRGASLLHEEADVLVVGLAAGDYVFHSPLPNRKVAPKRRTTAAPPDRRQLPNPALLHRGGANVGIRPATAPDSWGVWFPVDDRQVHWRTFLDEVVAAGYEAIELGPFGYLPTDVNVLRAELDSRGLALTGGTLAGDFHDRAALPALRDETARVSELICALGAHHLVLLPPMYTDLFTGEPTGPRELDDAGWQCMIDTLHELGSISARIGARAIVHPHVQSVIETEDQIERLLTDTYPGLVDLCLDIGHHAFAGGDPVTFLRTHAARIPYLHLKNIDGAVARRAEKDAVPFSRAVELGVMAELELGDVNFNSVRDAARAVRFEGWGVVEQDMYPTPAGVPLPVAMRNRAFLQRIGIG